MNIHNRTDADESLFYSFLWVPNPTWVCMPVNASFDFQSTINVLQSDLTLNERRFCFIHIKDGCF